MTAAPFTTPQPDDRMSYLQDKLTGFVDLGDRLLRLAVEKAEADKLPVEKAAAIYNGVTRSARKSAWLVRKLSEPVRTVNRLAARKRIIRVVEDTIQCHAEDPEDAETLHEELMERLDTPDLEDEISDRPVADIITDIIRDLGLAHVPGTHPWKRRTPDDIAELCALAAQPSLPVQRQGVIVPMQPQSPPQWPSQTHHQPVECNSS